jgi:ADP-ribose pyrophosphatase YjhB (NUDIX family)
MQNNNTNYEQSVTGVVIKDGKVLLARHTYGGGAGKLIVPGGFVEYDETPQAALEREYEEETGIKVKAENIIGIRFNMHDWYIAFRATYISGVPQSDNDENSEVVWVDIDEALKREDVPELTKKLIESAVSGKEGLKYIEYDSQQYPPYSFYGIS